MKLNVIFTNLQVHAIPDLSINKFVEDLISTLSNFNGSNYYIYTSNALLIIALRAAMKSKRLIVEKLSIAIMSNYTIDIAFNDEVEMFNNATIAEIDQNGYYLTLCPNELLIHNNLIFDLLFERD